MAIANFIPQIWSARLLANLDKNLVLGLAVNTNYEGDIRNVGDRVRIQRPNNITVGAYTGTVTYEAPTSTTRTLQVNQDKYFAFSIDDLDAVQANVNLVDTFTQRAAFALADDVDKFIASLYTGAGAGDVTVDLTTTHDMYATAVEAGQNLDEKNVPRIGRWMIISPAGYAALLKNTKFTQASDLGDSVVTSGALGRVAGMDVLVSNNLTKVTGTTKYLYGTSDSITYARQLLGEPEAIRLESKFEDAVRGRLAYGALVVEPDALGTITATETSGS